MSLLRSEPSAANSPSPPRPSRAGGNFTVPAGGRAQGLRPDLPRQGQLEQDAVVHPSRAAWHAGALHRLPHRATAGNFALWLAPDQLRVITLNDDEALINYAKPIVAELRANKVRLAFWIGIVTAISLVLLVIWALATHEPSPFPRDGD